MWVLVSWGKEQAVSCILLPLDLFNRLSSGPNTGIFEEHLN